MNEGRLAGKIGVSVNERKRGGIQNNRQGGKDGERLKRGVERVERNDKGFQEEAAGSRTGHDEPHAFTLYSQSGDFVSSMPLGPAVFKGD